MTLRHCTSTADYLKGHPYRRHGAGHLSDSKPTDGFTEDAMRFGWPGTVPQSVEEAYRGSTGQKDVVHVDYTSVGAWATLSTSIGSTKQPSTLLGDELPVEGVDFDPVIAPVGLSSDAEALLDAILDKDKSPDDLVAISRDATVTWRLLDPLVVRPCPYNSPPHIVDALRRAAAYSHSLYRYHGYVEGNLSAMPTIGSARPFQIGFGEVIPGRADDHLFVWR